MRTRVILSVGVVAVLLVVAVVALAPGLRERFMPAGAEAAAAPGGGQGRAAVLVVTASAKAEDFPIIRSSVGFLSSPTVASINARVASQVAEVAVKDGQDVKVGDLLFKLDDRALQAQLDKDTANLAKDQAAQTSAQLELTRDKDLLDKGVGTQQTYDQQGATAQEAVATVAADQAAIEVDKVQLSFATITAPIAGRLGEVNVSPGDSVAPATGASQSGGTAAPSALVTITQMDPLQVTFSLPETDLPLLQSGLANPTPPVVTLRLPGGTDPVATGTLDFINSSIDTTTGTIAARASIDNSAGKLWPGQYVEVSVQLGTLPGAVVVPTVAIQASQKGPFVYVAGADSKASIRQVTPSAAVDDTTALSDGLKAGENVVVEGQGRLQDGAAIREQQPGGGTGSATLKAAGTSK